MAGALKLPIIDLSAVDKISAANSVLQACTETGFFYVINHGIDEDMFEKLFCQSKNFFSLPFEEKKKLERKEHRGYIPFYSEKIDPQQLTPKESFYIGPFEDCLNQWPSQDSLPAWRETMEAYYEQILLAGKKLLSLIALALDLEENFFTLKPPSPFLCLLHYPGELHNGEVFGVSPHTDYGMVTLLATDGGPGLQVCREKDCQPRIWEDVPHIDGLLSSWIQINNDSVVECLASCCSESCPPKFPPIRSWDYLEQRFSATYI